MSDYWFDSGMTNKWVSVACYPVKGVTSRCKDGNIQIDIERCEAEDAAFWSVYVRRKSGEEICVADIPTQGDAECIVKLIEALSRNYIGEKPMNETVADIAFLAGNEDYYGGDSRADIQEFIDWAADFEQHNEHEDWYDSERDYLTELERFVAPRLTLTQKNKSHGDSRYPA